MIRMIANVGYREHTAELFTRFKIIKLEHLYNYKLLRTMHHSCPNFVNYSQLVTLTRQITHYDYRHTDIYQIPAIRAEYEKQSLSYTCPVNLNRRLLLDTDNAYNVKSKLKTYFLTC